MAAHRPEQRRVHRRVAIAHPDVVPRYEPTACYPGQRHCHEQGEPTKVQRPTDDWFTLLFPDDDTTTSIPTTTIPVLPTTSPRPSISTTSTAVTVLPTTSSTSLQTTLTKSSSSFILSNKSTTTLVRSQTAVGSVNSASSSALAQSGNTSTGAIVGGIGGGLIGFAVLASIVAFFLRRWRRKQQDPFNSADFRRSAVLLNDPPTHQDTVNAGFNARPPPSMTERGPGTFGTTYGATASSYAPYATEHSPISENYGQYSAYAQQSPSATSANPFMASAPYSPNPFSPVSSPIATSQIAEAPTTPQIFSRLSSSSVGQTTLSRQTSGKTIQDDETQYAIYPSMASDSARHSVPIPTSDYVDLSRSSVTPFQAAQYVEISKRIGAEVPSGLSTPAVHEHLQTVGVHNQDVPPPLPQKDRVSAPFDDPTQASRFSAASDRSDDRETGALDFPTPPSPALTSASRYRVDSTPPKLPEIRVESRASFGASTIGGLSPSATYDFPSSAVSSAFPSGVSSAAHIINVPSKGHFAGQGAFPVTPSPLNSSFNMPSPAIGGSFETAMQSPHQTDPNDARPVTVYDLDDAYGGI